jgi:hypothetical protein
MKFYRIRDYEYYLLTRLLKRVGATFEDTAFPQHTYISFKSIYNMKKIIKNELRRRYPKYSGKQIDFYCEVYMRNFAPKALGCINEHIILVDDRKIQEEIGKYIRKTKHGK